MKNVEVHFANELITYHKIICVHFAYDIFCDFGIDVVLRVGNFKFFILCILLQSQLYYLSKILVRKQITGRKKVRR